MRCTLVNGSAWCTVKKSSRRYKGTFNIFFGMKEEMKEQFNTGEVRMEVRSRRGKDQGR